MWSRDKNYVFKYLYNISDKIAVKILAKLELKDYHKKTMNKNPNYPKVPLYIFTPKVKLVAQDGSTSLEKLYIKLYKDKKYIVISFHVANKEK